MCESCSCKPAGKNIQYECDCPDDSCSCGIIEFDEVPKSIPYCCGVPIKRK